MAAPNYYRADGWVKTTLGPAIPGAQVYVLNQPANVLPPITPPRTIPVPFTPNPQALVYADAGITPIVQPIITDGFGHYSFYTLPGLYTVAVYYGGKLQQFYIDQSIGNVGSGVIPTLLLQTNGTSNFNQFLQNLVQGAGITLFTDNIGNTTISNTNSLSFSTPGIGGFFGPGLFDLPMQLSLQSSGNTIVTNAGEVRVCQFILPYSFTIRKVSWGATNNTSKHGSVGIYDINGNKLLDGGIFNQLVSPIVQTNTIAAVNLPAGIYLF